MSKTNFEKIKEMDIDCFALWLIGIGGNVQIVVITNLIKANAMRANV